MVKAPKRAKSRMKRRKLRVFQRAAARHVKLRKLLFVTC